MRWNINRVSGFLHREDQHRGPAAGVCAQDMTCTEHESSVLVCGRTSAAGWRPRAHLIAFFFFFFLTDYQRGLGSRRESSRRHRKVGQGGSAGAGTAHRRVSGVHPILSPDVTGRDHNHKTPICCVGYKTSHNTTTVLLRRCLMFCRSSPQHVSGPAGRRGERQTARGRFDQHRGAV